MALNTDCAVSSFLNCLNADFCWCGVFTALNLRATFIFSVVTYRRSSEYVPVSFTCPTQFLLSTSARKFLPYRERVAQSKAIKARNSFRSRNFFLLSNRNFIISARDVGSFEYSSRNRGTDGHVCSISFGMHETSQPHALALSETQSRRLF